jgi:hypothetical protein
MFLKITNPGVCYPEAFTLLGVSTARGVESKIGQFGSGSKMGVLTCLRHGINPIVVSGDMTVHFDCISKKMGDKRYEQVVANINGEKKELGFSLEFGAIDWTKIDYAIREFVSNAKDQGDCQLSVVDKIESSSKDSTSVYVEYTKEVKTYHDNLSKYFLSDKDCKEVILDNHSGKFLVYRKGVLVCEHDKKALFSYNIKDLPIDESRNAQHFMVNYHCTKSLENCSDKQIDKLLTAFIDGVDCVETKFDNAYFTNRFNKKLFDSFNRNYSGMKIVLHEMIQFCLHKNSNIIPVESHCFKILSDCGVPIAEIAGGMTGAKNGCIPIETTSDCKRIFNRVWGKVVKLGLHNGKDKPALAMYSKPMSCGSTLGGYYEDNTVYIDRNFVNAKVILEEIGHYITGASDCTRDFQDWAFNVCGALM